MTAPITIAPLTIPTQYAECERLQQSVWESTAVDVVPTHLLITFQRHGGVVLGAFDSNDHMVGFVFGFLGRVASDNSLAAKAEWQHCSHELGVVQEWRGEGVGYQLKLAQREWVMRQGLDVVTWTYDPLEMPNAVLNVGKLGAMSRCYLRNLYGTMTDALNANLPTDRFEVVWRLTSAPVVQRVTEGWRRPQLAALLEAGGVIANPAQVGTDLVLRPVAMRAPEANLLLVEVPANFQAVKRQSLGLALEWRLHTREVFEACFAAGYTVYDVVFAEVDTFKRAYYMLRRLD
jgi:predicted GNAT superfamily acetyltransferase